jgi:hypothetical protein
MKVIVYLLGFGHIAVCAYLILFTREAGNALKGWVRTYPLKYLSSIPPYLDSCSWSLHHPPPTHGYFG